MYCNSRKEVTIGSTVLLLLFLHQDAWKWTLIFFNRKHHFLSCVYCAVLHMGLSLSFTLNVTQRSMEVKGDIIKKHYWKKCLSFFFEPLQRWKKGFASRWYRLLAANKLSLEERVHFFPDFFFFFFLRSGWCIPTVKEKEQTSSYLV